MVVHNVYMPNLKAISYTIISPSAPIILFVWNFASFDKLWK